MTSLIDRKIVLNVRLNREISYDIVEENEKLLESLSLYETTLIDHLEHWLTEKTSMFVNKPLAPEVLQQIKDTLMCCLRDFNEKHGTKLTIHQENINHD